MGHGRQRWAEEKTPGGERGRLRRLCEQRLERLGVLGARHAAAAEGRGLVGACGGGGPHAPQAEKAGRGGQRRFARDFLRTFDCIGENASELLFWPKRGEKYSLSLACSPSVAQWTALVQGYDVVNCF